MDATEATTVKAERRRGWSKGVSSASLGIIVLAGLILSLALPRLMGAFLAVPASSVLEAVLAGETVPHTQLQAAIEQETRRLFWDGSADAPASLARLHQALAAHKVLGEAIRGQHRDSAAEYMLRAVERAPANVEWLSHLAWMRWRSPSYWNKTLPALRQATLAARYEPSLMFWRLDLWMRLIIDGVDMGLDDQRLWQAQLRLAHRENPQKLAELASRHGMKVRVERELAAAGVDL